MNITIIDYGAGNIRSVEFALERLGVQAKCSNHPDDIRQADKIIFPGVGEANTAMQALRECQLHTLIPTLTQPLLGICLGMQLLCDYSEEGDTQGLGIFPLNVQRFPDTEKVPHIGWNNIQNLNSPLFKGIPENSFVYYVHSYFVPDSPYTIAQTTYIKPYAAAIQRGNFYATQFHPEKSGDIGERILKNFLRL